VVVVQGLTQRVDFWDGFGHHVCPQDVKILASQLKPDASRLMFVRRHNRRVKMPGDGSIADTCQWTLRRSLRRPSVERQESQQNVVTRELGREPPLVAAQLVVAFWRVDLVFDPKDERGSARVPADKDVHRAVAGAELTLDIFDFDRRIGLVPASGQYARDEPISKSVSEIVPAFRIE